MSETLSPSGAKARSADPDRFYAALFAPHTKREALFALLAFNHEIARVREMVSEPIVGEMRLAWWSEVVEEIDAGGSVRAHPIAQALRDAHRASRFTLDRLRSLIDARSFDLYNEPMPDMVALTSYAEATGGALHGAMAETLDGEAAAGAASAIGTAWALTGVVRALPIHAARGQIYLPLTELVARGVSPAAVLNGEMSAGVTAVIGEVVKRARSYLVFARNDTNKRALPALLPGALLEAHWRRMERRSFDPFRAASEPPKVSTMWRLLAAAMRGHI